MEAAGSLKERSPLRLEVIAGNASGMFLLVEDDLVIGRQVEGPGRLADDEEISRSHARISRELAGHCAIEDLGSTNGTFVNGRRISSPQTLSEGDTIEVGSTTLVVRETPRVASAEPTASGPMAGQQTIVPRRVVAEPSDERPSTPPPSQAPAPQVESPPAVSLRLEIDFSAGQAEIALNDASDAVRLVFDAGAWHLVPASG